MARKNTKQTQLINNQELPFDTPELPARGTVYKDTCRQIAALAKAGKLDTDMAAGTIAQARSLAGVIDRASGLGGRKQETYALAGLHKQLAELLGRLSGTGGDESAAAAFLRLMAESDTTGPAGDGLEPLPAPPDLEVAAG